MKKNGTKMTLTPLFLEVASTHTPVDIQPWNIEPQKLKSYRCMWCDANFTTTNHACTRWRALFTTAPPRFPTLSTAAGATAKIPHNSSAEERTKFLRDHSEGEHLDQLGVHLDQLGVLLEPESDQATRAVNEGRHAETEFDRLVAAQVERRRVAHTTKIFKSETDLQIPKEVGDLDKLIIDVLLKPRIAEQAGCMNYESITSATKMTNNFLSEKTSMSFLMWTAGRCGVRV